VGIGAGALVLLVGGILVVNRNKGRGADVATAGGTDTAATQPAAAPTTAGAVGQQPATPQASPAATAKAAEPEPANLDDWGRFLRMTSNERAAWVATQRQAAIAAGDVKKLKDLHDWFDDPRVKVLPVAADTQKLCVEDALRIDGSSSGRTPRWAEEPGRVPDGRPPGVRHGVRLQGPRRAGPGQAPRVLQGEPVVDAKEFAKAEVVADRVRARNKQFQDSRAWPRMGEGAWLRDNPLFKEFKFEVRFADPYVICQQYEEFTGEEAHKNKDRIAKAQLIANRDAIIFTELNRHYRELLADRFKLPELQEKKRLLFATITWNHSAYIELYRKANNGDAPADWVRAFYSPPEQKIFHYIGDDSLRAQDECPVAKGRIQRSRTR